MDDILKEMLNKE